jgi:hypothetical protein
MIFSFINPQTKTKRRGCRNATPAPQRLKSPLNRGLRQKILLLMGQVASLVSRRAVDAEITALGA